MAIPNPENPLPWDLTNTEQLGDELPPPTYQEAIGPSMNLALRKDLVSSTPMRLTMVGVLNDYWVYKSNRDLLFRTHTLIVAKGTRVTHIPSNQKTFVLQTKKLKTEWRYYAEEFLNGSMTNLFKIESHEKFIKADVARMQFRNDFTGEDEALEVRKNRVDQKWEVWCRENRIADIDFPDSSSRWRINILFRGVDPSIVIALTLVIVVGARKLES